MGFLIVKGGLVCVRDGLAMMDVAGSCCGCCGISAPLKYAFKAGPDGGPIRFAGMPVRFFFGGVISSSDGAIDYSDTSDLLSVDLEEVPTTETARVEVTHNFNDNFQANNCFAGSNSAINDMERTIFHPDFPNVVQEQLVVNSQAWAAGLESMDDLEHWCLQRFKDPPGQHFDEFIFGPEDRRTPFLNFNLDLFFSYSWSRPSGDPDDPTDDDGLFVWTEGLKHRDVWVRLFLRDGEIQTLGYSPQYQAGTFTYAHELFELASRVDDDGETIKLIVEHTFIEQVTNSNPNFDTVDRAEIDARWEIDLTDVLKRCGPGGDHLDDPECDADPQLENRIAYHCRGELPPVVYNSDLPRPLDAEVLMFNEACYLPTGTTTNAVVTPGLEWFVGDCDSIECGGGGVHFLALPCGTGTIEGAVTVPQSFVAAKPPDATVFSGKPPDGPRRCYTITDQEVAKDVVPINLRWLDGDCSLPECEEGFYLVVACVTGAQFKVAKNDRNIVNGSVKIDDVFISSLNPGTPGETCFACYTLTGQDADESLPDIFLSTLVADEGCSGLECSALAKDPCIDLGFEPPDDVGGIGTVTTGTTPVDPREVL